MFCPKCGEEVLQDERICPHCGTELIPPKKEPEVEPWNVTDEESKTELAETQRNSTPEEPVQDEEDQENTPDDVNAPEGETEDQPDADAENAENVEGTENAEELEHTESAPEKKKKSPFAIVAGVVIVLLAVIVVCLCVALSYVSKGGKIPSLSELAEAITEKKIDADAVAVKVQDADGNTVEEITNQQLGFYFWGEYFYYVNSYGFSFDAAVPLEEQTYQEATDSETGETTVTTWKDFFLQNAQDSIIQTVALKQAAEADGFTMPEDYQSEYDSVVDSMATNAASAGFTDEDGNGDVLAYIQDSYGDDATVEAFEQYLYDSYYVSAYSDSVYKGFNYDDSQLDEYYDSHAEELQSYGIEKSDVPDVNVRHILIEPEADEDGNVSDEAWAAAEQKAQEVQEEWQSGDATEESFGELAATYSSDGGSNTNGGLYEDVHPGQMVTEFNDWCFDASRKPGDTGIVKTSYGYHVMYFVSQTDTYYYRTVAEQELRYEDYSEYITGLTDALTCELTKDADVAEPNAVKEIREQAAQQAAEAEQAAQEAQQSAAEDTAISTAEDSAADTSVDENGAVG